MLLLTQCYVSVHNSYAHYVAHWLSQAHLSLKNMLSGALSVRLLFAEKGKHEYEWQLG